MTKQASPAASDATLAAALFAIDPVGTGGVVLRSGWGPARDDWFARLQAMLPKAVPVRRVPPNVTDDRLLGGLDLAATLQAQRPIVERGLLAEADGPHPMQFASGRRRLAKGLHPIRIEFFEATGEAELQVTLTRDGSSTAQEPKFFFDADQ